MQRHASLNQFILKDSGETYEAAGGGYSSPDSDGVSARCGRSIMQPLTPSFTRIPAAKGPGRAKAARGTIQMR